MAQQFYGQMPPGFGQRWDPFAAPEVIYEAPMDPRLQAEQAASVPYEPKDYNPFDEYPYNDPNATLGGLGRSADIPGPVELPGKKVMEVAARPAPRLPPRPAPPRRDPADVRAMLTERARQQYERRFGTHAPGQGTASMASQGQAQDLDSLIRRLSGVGAIGLPTDAQYARMDRMRR